MTNDDLVCVLIGYKYIFIHANKSDQEGAKTSFQIC